MIQRNRRAQLFCLASVLFALSFTVERVYAQQPTGTSLPSELLVCENHGACNAAWTLHGSEGSAIWFARNPTRAKLSIIRSSPDNVLIRRTDTTDGVTATYAGSLRGDHYSGTIIFGSGEGGESATGTWTATMPHTTCESDAGLDPEDAMLTGEYALMFHQEKNALSCYVIAAKAGNTTAQTAVGLLYYQGGDTVEQNYAQAFFWLHKAADQGVYVAQRRVADMYLAGQGTVRNPDLAHIYTARADEQKHDVERRQDLADRAADRQAQIISSFVMGASFGLFF